MSQPLIYDDKFSLRRTYSENGSNKASRHEGISKTTMENKILELENFIKSNIGLTNSEVDEGEEAIEEIITHDLSGREAKFFYFIGRLNPPHNGHLKALEILVEMANAQNSTPLILLGSGPGSLRTMDNPISFEYKEYFINKVLRQKLPNSKFMIQKMTNPAKNVSDYVRSGLEMNSSKDLDFTNIEIKHIAGGKDEDTTKLLFALKSAEKTALSMYPEASIIAEVEPIEAETIDGEEAMSATKVRKDAYKSVIDGSGLEGWKEKYGHFYGDDSEEMYNQILNPLTTAKNDEERELMVKNYLNPQVKLIKRKANGGSRKKLHKKTIKKFHKKRKLSKKKYKKSKI